MKSIYDFGDVVVKLSGDHARINNGNLIPIKHDGKSKYVVRVIQKDNGCPKRVEKLRLSE